MTEETYDEVQVSRFLPVDMPEPTVVAFHDYFERLIVSGQYKNPTDLAKIVKGIINEDFIVRNDNRLTGFRFLQFTIIPQQATWHDLFCVARGFAPFAESEPLNLLDVAVDKIGIKRLLGVDTLKMLRSRSNFSRFLFELEALVPVSDKLGRPDLQGKTYGNKKAEGVFTLSSGHRLCVECKCLEEDDYLANLRLQMERLYPARGFSGGVVRIHEPPTSEDDIDQIKAEVEQIVVGKERGTFTTKWADIHLDPIKQTLDVRVTVPKSTSKSTFKNNLAKILSKFKYSQKDDVNVACVKVESRLLSTVIAEAEVSLKLNKYDRISELIVFCGGKKFPIRGVSELSALFD